MELQKRNLKRLKHKPDIYEQGMPRRALMIALLHMKYILYNKSSPKKIFKYNNNNSIKLKLAEVTGLIDKDKKLVWGDPILPWIEGDHIDDNRVYLFENNLVNIWCFLLKPIWEDWMENELLSEIDRVQKALLSKGENQYHVAYMIKDKVYVENEKRLLSDVDRYLKQKNNNVLKGIITKYNGYLGGSGRYDSIKNCKFHQNKYYIENLAAAKMMIFFTGYIHIALEVGLTNTHVFTMKYGNKKYDSEEETQLCLV